MDSLPRNFAGEPKYESLTPLVWKDGITRGYSLEQYFDQQRSRRLYIGTSGYSYSASVFYLSQYMCRMQDNDREPGYTIRPVHP